MAVNSSMKNLRITCQRQSASTIGAVSACGVGNLGKKRTTGQVEVYSPALQAAVLWLRYY